MRTAVRRRIGAFVVTTVVALSVPGVAHAGLATLPLSLTPTAGNTQVALAWLAPSSDGGEAISDYTVEWTGNAGVTWNRVIRTASTVLSYTVTGLTNGTTYIFRVSAVNGSGTGPVSATTTAIPFVVHSVNDPATYSACPTGVIPTAGFTDVTSTDVNCIAYYGVTKGTTATTYSPDDKVSRWQMALFLTRLATRSGATMPDGAAQGFTDISGYSTEIQTAVNQLKQLGVTTGTTATTYSPADNVTREQMALFINRLLKKAKVGPGGNTEYVTGLSGTKEIKSIDPDHNFTDIGALTLIETAAAIASLWNLGVTDVQTSTTYEPQTVITRRSMATFMANALAHTNARPAGVVLQPSGYRVQNGTPVTFSVTHRTADFVPIANTYVDTFKFHHTTVATTVRFDTVGHCTSAILVTSLSSVKCSADASDPKTDADGNLAVFTVAPPNTNFVDVWAWTAGTTTVYDNDVHATGASKVTVETHS